MNSQIRLDIEYCTQNYPGSKHKNYHIKICGTLFIKLSLQCTIGSMNAKTLDVSLVQMQKIYISYNDDGLYGESMFVLI